MILCQINFLILKNFKNISNISNPIAHKIINNNLSNMFSKSRHILNIKLKVNRPIRYETF